MIVPLFLFLCEVIADAYARTELREKSPAGAIDTGMQTFHEWLTDRTKNDGMWLNDRNDVVGMSNINPLFKKKAKVKLLKLPKAKLGVAP